MKILIKNSTIHILNMLFKDTHGEKVPSNKTQAFTKSMSMDIWVVGTLNLVSVRGSYNSIKFSKKIKECMEKRHSFRKVNFVLPILFALTSVFSKAALYGNVALSIIVLSSKKHCSSLLKKDLVFQKTCFKVKIIKTLKIPSESHVKTCQSLEQRAVLKISSTIS